MESYFKATERISFTIGKRQYRLSAGTSYALPVDSEEVRSRVRQGLLIALDEVVEKKMGVKPKKQDAPKSKSAGKKQTGKKQTGKPGKEEPSAAGESTEGDQPPATESADSGESISDTSKNEGDGNESDNQVL